MDTKLQLVSIIGTLLFAGILLYYLVTKKLHLKYCLIWILAIIAMLISAIFPDMIKWLASQVGIKTPSNLIFVVYGLFMLLIVLTLTAIVSHMNIRIFRLVQYQAILEERIRKIEQIPRNTDISEYPLPKEEPHGQSI